VQHAVGSSAAAPAIQQFRDALAKAD
jgi:hypothetical protein